NGAPTALPKTQVAAGLPITTTHTPATKIIATASPTELLSASVRQARTQTAIAALSTFTPVPPSSSPTSTPVPPTLTPPPPPPTATPVPPAPAFTPTNRPKPTSTS